MSNNNNKKRAKKIQMKIHNFYPFPSLLASNFIVFFFSFGFFSFFHFHLLKIRCVYFHLSTGFLFVFMSNDHIFVQNTAEHAKVQKRERNRSIYSVFCFGRMNKMRIKYVVQNNIKYIFISFFFVLLRCWYPARVRISTQLESTLTGFHLEFTTSRTPTPFLFLIFYFSVLSWANAHPLVCVLVDKSFVGISLMAMFCVIPIQVAIVSVVWYPARLTVATNRDARFVCFNSSHSIQ